jgi:hypothetical protein
MPSTLARRLRLAIPVAAIALFAIAPAAASAGPLVASAPDCAAQTLGQPFLPWYDVASYTLDPGGSFEPGTADWSLSGAAVTDGNEPWRVGDAGDSRSLSIPSGASATSATICVGIGHPDIRFFARSSSATARLHVQVLFEDSSGNVVSAPIGAMTLTPPAWSLGAPMPIVANLLPLLPNDMTPVEFRFTASGGSFQIDDLYVDPYRYG